MAADYGKIPVITTQIMDISLRKVLVWLLSLFVVGGLYFLYVKTSRRPVIEAPPPPAASADANGFASEIGTIGDVGVANVEFARYMNFNENGTVSSEFGFARLLHDMGDSWEIEKPFMNVFQPDFTCNITADTGHVLLEGGVKKPSPKDAALTGNVKIKIIPTPGSNFKQGVFYLDDIVFTGENSLLSSKGPVRFVSEDISLSGTGFELIYNQELDKIEFLRIVSLENLNIRVAAADNTMRTPRTMTSDDNVAGESAPPAASAGYRYRCLLNDNVKIDSPRQLILANKILIHNILMQGSDNKTLAVSDQAPSDQNDIGPAPEKEIAVADQNYVEITVTCDDGIVVTPMDIDDVAETASGSEQLPEAPSDAARRTIFNANRIDYDLSTDIAAAKGETKITFYTADDLAQADAALPVKITTHKETRFLPEPGQIIFEGDCLCVVPRKGPDGDSTYTLSSPKIIADLSRDDENTEAAVSFGGVKLLTAEGPVTLSYYKTAQINETTVEPMTITAQEKAIYKPGLSEINFTGNCLCTAFSDDANKPQKYTFRSPDIAITLVSDREKLDGENISGIERLDAKGPVELAFYPDNSADVNEQQMPAPLKVTAKEKAEFVPALNNQVTFVGDCFCIMTETQADSLLNRTLSAPLLTINLADGNDTATASAGDIKHVTAHGGDVHMATLKTAGSKLLGGYELRCARFEYDSPLDMLTAFGPGIIKVDNSNIDEPNASDASTYSFKRRCYATVEDFNSLQYFLDTKKIVAESGRESLVVNYIPVEGSNTVTVIAGHIEAILAPDPAGQDELAALAATRGIRYEDDTREFFGSELYYDSGTSLVKVSGDNVRPCLLNGAAVDQIEFDLKTNKIKANVVGPGVLQLK
jgi:hypothetical protein